MQNKCGEFKSASKYLLDFDDNIYIYLLVDSFSRTNHCVCRVYEYIPLYVMTTLKITVINILIIKYIRNQ